MKPQSFFPLFATNFFGVANDNFLKTLASFTVIGWLADERAQSVFMGLTAGALVLPYILFSPLADRLTAVFPKKKILRLAKWAELPIMAVAIIGFVLASPALVVASVLLMGLQSSLYSPAKYALVRDVGGVARISTGMGGMEGVAFLAVLGGTIAASLAMDYVTPAVRYAALALFACLGLAFSYAIRAEEELNRALHSVNPIRYMKRAYRLARGYPGLNAVIVTLSVFWWAAAMLQMGLLVYGKHVLHLDATHTGLILALAAIGIVAGQVIAGFVDRRHFLLGAVLPTGWIAAAFLAILFFVPMSPLTFGLVVAVLAFDFGFFKLPLDAEIQKIVKGPKLNTMLAYFNQVSFLFMLAASGCYALVSWAFGPRAFLLLLACAMAVVPVAFMFTNRKALCFTGRWLFRKRYDVELEGLELLEKLDAEGKACLVLPNHPAMIDPMLVVTELWRTPLRPLVDEQFFSAGIVAAVVLKSLNGIPVPDLRRHRTRADATAARQLDGRVTDALARGGNVIFYPSGHLQTTPDREEIGTRQLAYNVCRELPPGVEVIGVRTRGLWGSIWSRARRTASPAFVPTLVKSVLLWFFVAPFMRRRKVILHLENLTMRAREWASTLTRLEFNRRLEAWYNSYSPCTK